MSYQFIKLVPIPAPLRDIEKANSETNKGIVREIALANAAPALLEIARTALEYAPNEVEALKIRRVLLALKA